LWLGQFAEQAILAALGRSAPGDSTWAAWMYRSVIDACECPALSST
jgi:hypothetical protein